MYSHHAGMHSTFAISYNLHQRSLKHTPNVLCLEHFGVGQAPRSAGHEESLCSEELLNTAADRLEAAATSDVKRCEETFFFLMGKLLRQSMGKLPEWKVILPSIAAKFVFCGSSKMFKDV